jgi:uncharacterized protein YndB with AHSA1/START domain
MSKEVNIERIFNAPRKLVFKAWSNKEHLLNWYAPDSASIIISKFEFKSGGVFQHCVKTDSGYLCHCKGIYLEIIPEEKIIYSIGFCDEAGNSLTSSEAGIHNGWPDEIVTTLTFEDIGKGKTKLTLHQSVYEALAKETGAYPSWLQMLDKLESLLGNN